MPDTTESTDRVAAYLADVREREQAATPGPWWSDQDDGVYRLHGVAGRIPAQDPIPEQVMNKQIAKAPKQGTPYAEYWPDEADDAFITQARTDLPRLLAAVERVLELAERPSTGIPPVVICEVISQALLGEAGAQVQPATKPTCICTRFRDTGGFRIADLTCPVHGIGGTKPGDGYWDEDGA